MSPVGEPTQPRGPIAAMYSSPGPRYMLPGLVGRKDHDPRSVHNRGPAWPILGRHSDNTNDSSPGPCYKPEERMYRNGMDTANQFSLKGRPKDLTSYAGPGPGAYSPEGSRNISSTRPPAYTMNGRHDDFKSDSGPGPNHYNLDPMLGKTVRSNKASAPNHSLKGRSKTGGFHEDLQKTPGPGSYLVTDPGIYKAKSPQVSITSRHPMPGDTSLIPGPAHYHPLRQRNGTGPTFGIRHSQYSGSYITAQDCE